jgi:predicted type IV restriction endonuclease
MKFYNAEQFAVWLQGVFDERLRTCLEAMRAAGYTSDEVAEAAVVLTEESERARLDVLAQVQRIMADPRAPSHFVN